MTVAVVGSLNLDHVVEASAFPRPGETVHGLAVRTSVGGKGANQAVAAALAGAPVSLIGRVGTDGSAACQTVSAFGVDVSRVAVMDDRPTGTAWITVAGGENTIVVVPGANAAWSTDWPTDGDAAAVAGAAVVLCQLEVPTPVVEAAARTATGTFVLNASPAAELPAALLTHCDVLLVNEHELAVVAGAGGAAGLLSRGVGTVVTTLGPRGATITDARGTVTVPAPPADAVDTTGAGDAFAGVLCARLAVGDPLPEAVRWAVVAGSLAVRAAGTHDAYPDAATLADQVRRSARASRTASPSASRASTTLSSRAAE